MKLNLKFFSILIILFVSIISGNYVNNVPIAINSTEAVVLKEQIQTTQISLPTGYSTPVKYLDMVAYEISSGPVIANISNQQQNILPFKGTPKSWINSTTLLLTNETDFLYNLKTLQTSFLHVPNDIYNNGIAKVTNSSIVYEGQKSNFGYTYVYQIFDLVSKTWDLFEVDNIDNGRPRIYHNETNWIIFLQNTTHLQIGNIDDGTITWKPIVSLSLPMWNTILDIERNQFISLTRTYDGLDSVARFDFFNYQTNQLTNHTMTGDNGLLPSYFIALENDLIVGAAGYSSNKFLFNLTTNSVRILGFYHKNSYFTGVSISDGRSINFFNSTTVIVHGQDQCGDICQTRIALFNFITNTSKLIFSNPFLLENAGGNIMRDIRNFGNGNFQTAYIYTLPEYEEILSINKNGSLIRLDHINKTSMNLLDKFFNGGTLKSFTQSPRGDIYTLFGVPGDYIDSVLRIYHHDGQITEHVISQFPNYLYGNHLVLTDNVINIFSFDHYSSYEIDSNGSVNLLQYRKPTENRVLEVKSGIVTSYNEAARNIIVNDTLKRTNTSLSLNELSGSNEIASPILARSFDSTWIVMNRSGFLAIQNGEGKYYQFPGNINVWSPRIQHDVIGQIVRMSMYDLNSNNYVYFNFDLNEESLTVSEEFGSNLFMDLAGSYYFLSNKLNIPGFTLFNFDQNLSLGLTIPVRPFYYQSYNQFYKYNLIGFTDNNKLLLLDLFEHREVEAPFTSTTTPSESSMTSTTPTTSNTTSSTLNTSESSMTSTTPTTSDTTSSTLNTSDVSTSASNSQETVIITVTESENSDISSVSSVAVNLNINFVIMSLSILLTGILSRSKKQIKFSR